MKRVRLAYRVASPLRADLILKAAAEAAGLALSRRKLKPLFEGDFVRAEGRTLDAQDVVSLTEGALEVDEEAWSALLRAPVLAPAPGPLVALLADGDGLFAIDKPSGMPSAPISANETGTAVHQALGHFPELVETFPDRLEPGLLHRLDNDTSGALLFARTEDAFGELRANWKTPRVKKTYRALARPATGGGAGRTLPPTPFLVETALGHDAKSDRRMKPILKDEDLKRIRGNPLPARTHVLAATKLADGTYDFTVEIETGVMHQIRVHLMTLGFPILGDSVYGGAVTATDGGGAPESRLWLHAWKIDIHRDSGRRIAIEAPLPGGWPGRSG